MQRRDLIPRSFVSTFIKEIRGIIRTIQTTCSIPEVAYQVRFVLLYIQILLPGLLPLVQTVWTPDQSSTNMLTFLAFFAYWGTIFGADASQQIITAIACSILCIIFITFPVIVWIIHKRLGTVPSWLGRLVLWICDIIIPSLLSWAFSEAGAGLGMISRGDRDANAFVSTICPLVFGALLIVLMSKLYFREVAYHPVRSIYWASKYHTEVVVYTCVRVLLARYCVEVSWIGIVGAILISLVFSIGLVIILCLMPHFLRQSHNVIVQSLIVTSTVLQMVQLVRVVGLKIDQDIVLLLIPFLVVLTAIGFQMIAMKTKTKLLAIVDILSNSEEEFDTFIQKPKKIIEIYRHCFDTAHGYLLSYDLLEKGINLWPDDKQLWCQYIRFVAMYQCDTTTLLRVNEEIHKRFRDDDYLKSLRVISRGIITSRNKHMSSELKSNVKGLRVKQKELMNLQAAFWSAAGEGSMGTYAICRDVMRLTDEIEAEYLTLLSQYPKCESLYMKFSQFFERVEGDYKEASYWKRRCREIKNQNNNADVTETLARATFPALPPFKSMDECHNVMPNGSRASQSSRASILSRNGSISMGGSMAEQGMVDEVVGQKEEYSNYVRQTSLGMKLGFVDAMIWTVIAFFMIMCCAGPILPSISLLKNIDEVELHYRVVKEANDMTVRFQYLQYLFTLDTGRMDDTFLTKEEEDALMGISYATDVPIKQAIAESRIALLASAKELIRVVSDCYGKVGDVWQMYFASTVVLYMPGNREELTSSLPEAIEILLQHVTNFDEKSNEPYTHEEWFKFFDLNSGAPIVPLLMYSFEIYSKLMESFTDRFNTSKIIVVILCVVAFIFLAIFIAQSVNILRKWQYVVSVMRRLPKSAIHKVISRFSSSASSNHVQDSERLYHSDFLKMAAAKTSTTGIPIATVIILCTVMCTLSVIAVACILITTGDNLEYVNGIANRYNQVASVMYIFYYTLTKDLHYVAAKMGRPFDSDNYGNEETNVATLKDIIKRLTASITGNVDSLLIGDTKSSQNNNSPPRSFMTDRNEETMKKAISYASTINFAEKLNAHDFVFRNPDFTYICLLETLMQRLSVLVEHDSVKEDTHELIEMNHMMVQHFIGRIHVPYGTLFTESSENLLNKLVISSVVYPYLLAAVNMIIFITVIIILTNVKRIIRRSVAFFCGIDFEVLASNGVFTDLINGIFDSRAAEGTTAEDKLIAEILDNSDYVVLEVTPDLNVRCANKVIESKWQLRSSECTDISMNMIVTLTIPEFTSEMNTEITLVRDTSKHRVNVYCYRVGSPHSKKANYVYFFEDLTESLEAKRRLADEYAVIEKLKEDVIPDSVLKLVERKRSGWLYRSKKIAMIGITFSNFEDMTQQDDPVQRLKKARTIIGEYAAERKDLDRVKQIGLSEYFAVNMGGTIPAGTHPDVIAFNYCKGIIEALQKAGMNAGASITTDQDVDVGMTNPGELNFDIFSRGLRICRLLSNHAKPGSILIDPVRCANVSDMSHHLKMNPVSIQFGTSSIQCREFVVHVDAPEEAPQEPTDTPAQEQPAKEEAEPEPQQETGEQPENTSV